MHSFQYCYLGGMERKKVNVLKSISDFMENNEKYEQFFCEIRGRPGSEVGQVLKDMFSMLSFVTSKD